MDGHGVGFLISLISLDLQTVKYEVEGARPTGRPKKTWTQWTEIVEKDCQALKLNKVDAMDRKRRR